MKRAKQQAKNFSHPRWLRTLLPIALIVVWLGAATAGGPLFGRISEVSELDLAAFLPDSAESTKVQDKISDFIDTSSVPALVVHESDGSKLSDETIVDIKQATKELDGVDGVIGDKLGEPFVSEDGKATLVAVPIDSDAEVSSVVEEIRAQLDEGDVDSISNYVTGPAGFSADLNEAFSGIDGLLLVVALAVVFVILIVVYRSPVLPVIVLMTSVLALAASILIVFTLAKADIVTINGQVQGILFILVIGAATDYSLLYVSRYREELYYQKSKTTATLRAIRGSVEPVLASGGTVIAGLLCLLLSDLASNQALGPVGSIGILLAMASALTFLPSVLALVGRTAFWPYAPRADKTAQTKHHKQIKTGVWSAVGEFVSKYPRRIWITTIVLLAVASLGIFGLKADGVAQSDLISGYSEAREGQEVLAEHFSDGFGTPLYIAISKDKQQEAVESLDNAERIGSVSVTADIDQGSIPVGKSEVAIRDQIRTQIKVRRDGQIKLLEQQHLQVEQQSGSMAAAQMYERATASIPSVESLVDEAYPYGNIQPVVIDDQVLLQATLKVAPDSDEALEVIEQTRQSMRVIDSEALVGGTTAIQLDTNVASIRDRSIIIPAVLVAITLILMVLLRSVAAPLLLLGTTVLSFGTALGVSAVVFNNILGHSGADPSVVLYAFVFLVALGIDYNIFLMTRVREESLKIGTHRGVIKGLVVTGGVITSAGVVLAATFSALAVIPILFLLQIAFIVAFGVLLDTIVVRSLLVPALIRDIGHKVWWPARIKK